MFNAGDRVTTKSGQEGRVVIVEHHSYLKDGTDDVEEIWQYSVKIPGEKEYLVTRNPDDLTFIREGTKSKWANAQEALDFLEGRSDKTWVDRAITGCLDPGPSLKDLLGES